MFLVLLHPRAKEAFDKLGGSVCQRIRKKLEELKEHPERGKHLKHSVFRSPRIGDYRAIYEVDREGERVIVFFIGHRKHVYDDFSKLL